MAVRIVYYKKQDDDSWQRFGVHAAVPDLPSAQRLVEFHRIMPKEAEWKFVVESRQQGGRWEEISEAYSTDRPDWAKHFSGNG